MVPSYTPPNTIEQLESRLLLASDSAVLQPDGTLVITGTDGHDRITVYGQLEDSNQFWADNFRDVDESRWPPYIFEFQEVFDPGQIARIVIHGGAGDDIIRLHTRIPSEIFGDEGNDAITAWSGTREVHGGTPVPTGGSHIVHGGDGRDYISTGDGDDTIYGDASPDLIFGHGGHDLISGGGGGDVIHGYDGRDRIYGGMGSDLLFGETHADRIFGQEGDDTLIGGGGADLLNGGAGRDLLRGIAGDDLFTADDGEADTLEGGSGNDTGTFDELLDEQDDVLTAV